MSEEILPNGDGTDCVILSKSGLDGDGNVRMRYPNTEALRYGLRYNKIPFNEL